MKYFEKFTRGECISVYGDYEIYARPILDRKIPYSYIVFVRSKETGNEDYRLFDRAIDLNKNIFRIIETL